MIHHSDKFRNPQKHAAHDDHQYHLDKGLVKKGPSTENVREEENSFGWAHKDLSKLSFVDA